METEGACLGNRFIQPKQVTQHSMQPLGQLLGNRLWKCKGTVGQPLMEMEGDCLSKRL
jgi:hypothetical protein